MRKVSKKNERLSQVIFVLVIILAGIMIGVQFSDKEPVPEREVAVIKSVPAKEIFTKEVIGHSVLGRNLESHTFGDGDKTILFVGGMHGGYEWNSVLLAYRFVDYLTEHPEFVPKGLKIAVIPVANPDGLYAVVGKEGMFTPEEVSTEGQPVGFGRLNANDVDLNRNFDCNWESTSMWRGNIVKAGTSPFSEPESVALRDYIYRTKPMAAIFWHSQSNAVYASECNHGVLPETLVLMNSYANASGYKPVKSFDAYKITGDIEGWLASINIPAITVELETHETIEWDKNLAGATAVLDILEEVK